MSANTNMISTDPTTQYGVRSSRRSHRQPRHSAVAASPATSTSATSSSTTTNPTIHNSTEVIRQASSNETDTTTEEVDAYMTMINEAARKIDLTQHSACPCHRVLNYQLQGDGMLHVPIGAGSRSGYQPTASKRCTCGQALGAAYQNSHGNTQG
ncbi:uncharacterized protein BDZ99DRAFT_570742 [Mytilinidion resinicola]|uniref:Uncharacterized protein n=1 Tax=Mytilinidion resinicola TaxID=574789 RepID=A0A6A6YMV4_9PEZI|nr:uncharacterized protein BDZ99DRAFT_570742 [Mytilinidion resinicola]KAF2810120.1 hypothetical protein BDZ99DRAFT_570742 [Mytilinidion resinicola]